MWPRPGQTIRVSLPIAFSRRDVSVMGRIRVHAPAGSRIALATDIDSRTIAAGDNRFRELNLYRNGRELEREAGLWILTMPDDMPEQQSITVDLGTTLSVGLITQPVDVRASFLVRCIYQEWTKQPGSRS